MRTYPLGEQITASTQFLNPRTNMPADPTSVRFRTMDPDGIVSTPAVTHPQVGLFIAQFVPTKAGIWYTRWDGAGSIQSSVEHQIEIKPSAFS